MLVASILLGVQINCLLGRIGGQDITGAESSSLREYKSSLGGRACQRISFIAGDLAESPGIDKLMLDLDNTTK